MSTLTLSHLPNKLEILDPAFYYQANEVDWRKEFISVFGKLNCENFNTDWWAYGTTSKNFLSSKLGNNVFQILLIIHLIEQSSIQSLYVKGASKSQIKILSEYSKEYPKYNLVIRDQTKKIPAIYNWINRFCRNTYYFICIFYFHIVKFNRKKINHADILLLTYLDSLPAPTQDPFFGDLTSRLRKKNNLEVATVFHINSNRSVILKNRSKLKDLQYIPLFDYLSFSNLFICWLKSCFIKLPTLNNNKNISINNINIYPLVYDSLYSDLKYGSYMMNQLVYHSSYEMFRYIKPKRFLYPFENKSIEKMMLLSLVKTNAEIRSIGYQHTSITPRHTTLLFSENEASITPLPDCVITAGKITREYLERYGCYPKNFFITGCALRQKHPKFLEKNQQNKKMVRILVAPSSSHDELLNLVKFIIRLKTENNTYEIGLRQHPEFPISKLPKEIYEWVKMNTVDLAKTSLEENISWCNVCIYVSSTISLEVMMYGKPVINLRFNDAINPDPILNNPPWHWQFQDISKVIDQLERLKVIIKKDCSEKRRKAILYAQDYFIRPSEEYINYFLNS